MGTWESVGTPKISEFDFKSWNTSHWSVLYIIGKLSKCRCRKWACMSHLDICSISYDKKKGWKSNWQFDSRPLKIRNRPNFLAFRQRVTYHWNFFDEGYNFASKLIVIEGLHKKLCTFKVARVPTVAISRLSLSSPGTKSHLNVALVESCSLYYMGEDDRFPRVRVVVSLVNLESPVTCPTTKGVPKNELTNLLVGWMQIQVSNWKLLTLPTLILEPQHALLPLLVLRVKSVPRTPNNSTV
jgi:hypothetical protein